MFETIESLKKEITLYMSEATFGELRFGAEKSQNKTKNLERIERFREGVPLLPVDQQVWTFFGKIKAELSKVGRIISDMDILIAATAKSYDLVLATSDSVKRHWIVLMACLPLPDGIKHDKNCS
ncbi:MAG: PIN domain-containing protein [Pseudomonadota bacterium]